MPYLSLLSLLNSLLVRKCLGTSCLLLYLDLYAASSAPIFVLLTYMAPGRESQVLVMLGSPVITSLELQFPFG